MVHRLSRKCDMSEISFLPITWSRLQQDVLTLAKKVRESDQEFDRLVCIERGGIIVSRLLSDFLKLPTSGFVMVSYKEFNQLSQPVIAEELKVDIHGERILLVDEIVDSGTTFRLALEYLQGCQPADIKTFAPYIKPTTKTEPDYWLVKTDQWVVFPYEVRETVEDLKELMCEKNLSEDEIIAQLVELNFPEAWVKYFYSTKA